LELADRLISDGVCERVIICPIAVGSTFCIDFSPTGIFSKRIPAARARLAAHGLYPSLWVWHQGEGDKSLGSTEAQYTAALSSIIDEARDAGDASPWFICRASYGGGLTSADVIAGQNAVIDEDNLVFAGPNTDLLTGALYRDDDVHFNAVGAAVVTELLNQAIQDAIDSVLTFG
jgi:lysophospholipase L1-like esterase